MPAVQRLKDRHAGERCVIVANGPSLNCMNLSFLRNEITIGSNKIYLGFRKFAFYPKYYVAVNPKVLGQAEEEILRLTCVKLIAMSAAERIPETPTTYHLNTTDPPARFCHDISRGVHEGWTVTFVALQIAFYLGFKEVVLIGLDHRFDYIGAPNETRTLEGPDPNHFSADYFGFGQCWDNPDLDRSEESFQIARKEFELAGRRIIDATLGGSCTVFPKADYRDVFDFGAEGVRCLPVSSFAL